MNFREIPRSYAVDDGIVVFLLHEDLIHAQDKGRSEFGSDPVEVVVGRLVALHLAGLISVRTVQVPHPGALDDLEGFLHDQRTRTLFSVCETSFQSEAAVFHFLRRCVSWPAELHGPFEIFPVIRNEVDGTFSRAQNVLGRIGRVAAVQEHCVILLACHVIRLDQTVRTEAGRPVLRQRADQHGRHREKQRGLVKIVYDSQIFKAAHGSSFHKRQGTVSVCLLFE